MCNSRYLISLQGEETDVNVGLIGQKVSKLIWLNQNTDFKIPYGFCITGIFFKENKFDNRNILVRKIKKLIIDNIKPELFYAIRSSSNLEDGVENSFAGQFESFLAIKGLDLLCQKIIDCYLSFENLRSSKYKKMSKIKHTGEMLGGVLVQEMIPSSTSGILFTSNPLLKHDDTIVINSAYGLGDVIVEGKITPDEIFYNRLKKHISFNIGSKKIMSFINGTALSVCPVPVELRKQKSISDIQIIRLINISLEIESKINYPIDIEWALSKGEFYILQIRPITYGKN